LSSQTFVCEHLDWRIGDGGKIGMAGGSARFFLAASLLTVGEAAQGGETVTYGYDSLGRLVSVSRSGTVNNGVEARYTYDSADNRTNVTVGGAPAAAPAAPAGAAAPTPAGVAATAAGPAAASAPSTSSTSTTGTPPPGALNEGGETMK
jgi:YD repeat-containing protein